MPSVRFVSIEEFSAYMDEATTCEFEKHDGGDTYRVDHPTEGRFLAIQCGAGGRFALVR